MTTETYTEEIPQEKKVDLSDALKVQIEKNVLLGFLMMVTSAYAFLTTQMASDVAVGGLIALLNFRDLKRSLERFFTSAVEGRKSGSLIVARYYFKMSLLLIVLAFLLKSGKVDVIGLALGLFLVPATLIFTGVTLYIGSLGGNKR